MLHRPINDLTDRLAPLGLRASGGVARHGESIVLLSPSPGFWPLFSASPEHQDGQPDPMDRWSRRVITALANDVRGTAYFPFGRDAAPFFRWALDSGRAWSSPVQLLVEADMGLNISYRGAIGFAHAIPFPTLTSPCEACAGPCTTACPVGALTEAGYDVPACKDYLTSNPDAPCRTGGCLVRRACPVSTPQVAAHAQFHMEAFLG